MSIPPACNVGFMDLADMLNESQRKIRTANVNNVGPANTTKMKNIPKTLYQRANRTWGNSPAKDLDTK